MSAPEYWQIVNELVEAGAYEARPKHEVREDIVHQVTAAAAAGERWAIETVTRWELDGAAADYTRAFKNMNTTTYITRGGRRVRKTVAYSRPTRDAVTGEIIGQQMQSWWCMSRGAIAHLRNDLANQANNLEDAVAAVDQIIEAYDRHPHCATAREAWEADGRSTDEINLEELEELVG